MLSRKKLFVRMVAPVVLLLATTGSAFAGGTTAGTDISGKATINYQVNSLSQPVVESSPTGNAVPGSGAGTLTTFKVDKKVDLTVTTNDPAIVEVTPGATAQVLSFTVTNTGNAVQDYILTALNSATGAFSETENFDATNVQVFVESGSNAGYLLAEDVGLFIDNLAADASKIVYIVADIPNTRVDADVSSFDLLAQAAVGGEAGQGAAEVQTSGADNITTVDVVFADALGTASGDVARDGKNSSKSGFKCKSAKLTVTKTLAVVSDPFNNASNPKAIPGAVVEYTITVANGGTVPAASVALTDQLSVTVAPFLVGSVTTTGGGTATIAYSNDSGSTWVYTPVADGNGADAAVTNVRVTFSSIANAANAVAKFSVKIK